MKVLDFTEHIITKVFISDIIKGTTMIILGDDEGNRRALHFWNDIFELIKEAIIEDKKVRE